MSEFHVSFDFDLDSKCLLTFLCYGCKQSKRSHSKLQAFYALSAWFILLPRGIVIDSIGFDRLLELAVVALNLPSHNTKNFIAMVYELVTSKCNCLFLQVQFSAYISEY